MATGKVVIVSGPSGAGKTTVVKRLIQSCAVPLKLSVSATTRPARPSEQDGIDYQFMSDEEFQRRKSSGDFLECFEVFGSGYWYGTLRSEVTTSLDAGKWVLLEIDVQGMQSVQDQFPGAISIFIRPSSLAELEQRLRGRATESEKTIQRRLEVAAHEWSYKTDYTYDIVNESVEDTVTKISQALSSHA
ncbi:MAG: guanylate kinase [Planctomycetaceae bacterium]|nr:guanylate kinase [Planctomycetaceae bacterium]